MRKIELLIFVIFMIVFLAVALYVNTPKIHPGNYHMGAEYSNIATSIVNGKGYGNTFGTDSGPAPGCLRFLHTYWS